MGLYGIKVRKASSAFEVVQVPSEHRLRIIISVAGLHEGVSRVDDFGSRCLACLVPQVRQAHTFTRQVGNLSQGFHHRLGGMGLMVRRRFKAPSTTRSELNLRVFADRDRLSANGAE